MSNLFQMLQGSAEDVVSASSARMHGVEVAFVTDNVDPLGLGRVRVTFPRLSGQPQSDWARVAVPAAGEGRGFCWVPEVQDEVLVAFERGEAARAYVVGCLWSGAQRPPLGEPPDAGDVRRIRTRSGHVIMMDDTPGRERLVIADGTGSRTITWDVAAARWILEASRGDVEIHAPNGHVRIDCRRFELNVMEDAELHAEGRLSVRSGQASSFEAGPAIHIRASRVNIN